MTERMVNPPTREELEAKWEQERLSTQRFWLTIWIIVLAAVDFWWMKYVFTNCTARSWVPLFLTFGTGMFILAAIFYPLRALWFVFNGKPHVVADDWRDIKTWYLTWYKNHPQRTVLLTVFIPFTIYTGFFRFHDETIYQPYPPYDATRVMVTDGLTGHQYSFAPVACMDDDNPDPGY